MGKGPSKRSARRRHQRIQSRARWWNTTHGGERADRVPPNTRPITGPSDEGGFLRGVMRKADDR